MAHEASGGGVSYDSNCIIIKNSPNYKISTPPVPVGVATKTCGAHTRQIPITSSGYTRKLISFAPSTNAAVFEGTNSSGGKKYFLVSTSFTSTSEKEISGRPSFSDKGNFIAYGKTSSTITVADYPNQSVKRTVNDIYPAVFSNDETILSTYSSIYSASSTVKLWNTSDGSQKFPSKTFEGNLGFFSPNNQFLATSSESGGVKYTNLYKLSDGSLIKKLNHNGWRTFSPDSKVIFTSDSLSEFSSSFKAYNTSDGSEIDLSKITSAKKAIHHDGQTIIGLDADGTIKIWELK